MATFAGTSSDDFIIATVNGTEYRGGAGNDTYIITSLIPANAVISIVDTEGANKIQLADGLTIASSSFLANAVELTLSNGAKVQVTGASTFTYDIGANAVAGDSTGTVGQTYTQFAAALGVPTLPATGSTAGTPSFVVPNSSAPATPSFTVAGPATATEGGNATYTVSLSAAQSTATTVSYAVTFGGGATSADLGDGTALTGTLTFAAGEVSKTIVLPVKFDTTAETGEQAIVTLSSSSTGTQLGATKSVTTALNDAPAASFTLKSDASGTPTLEGSNITFTVTPSGIVTQDTTLTVNLTGAAVGAIVSQASASDFSPASQTLTFKAGSSTAQTAVISVLSDNVTEGIEGYKASLLDGSFNELSSITGTINDGSVQGGTGQIFTLTTNTDAIAGTSGNDTFVATNATLTTADNINGGAGTDTLDVTIAAAANPLVTLSSVENVKLTSAVATLAGPLNATNWTGVEKVTVAGLGVAFSDSVVAGTTGNTILNLQNNVTLGVSNAASTADNGAVLYAGFGSGKVGSATATLNLELNGVVGNTANTGVANIQVDTAGTDKFTKLNVSSTGTNRVQLEGNDAAEISLTDITVTGAGSTNLSVDATNAVITNLATVNAGSATGALTANVSASTKDVTFTGSAGKNTITFGNGNNIVAGGAADDSFTLGTGNNTVTGAAGNDRVIGTLASFTAADSIDLGDGARDAIIYSDVTQLNSTGVPAANKTVLGGYKNIEAVGSSQNAVTAIDAGYFTQSIFELSGTNTAVAVTNVENDTVILRTGIVGATGGAGISFAGALPNQTLNLEIGGAASLTFSANTGAAGDTAITIASGISTVNLVSTTTAASTTGILNTIAPAGGTATHTIDNASAGSFVLTGNTDLTITKAATAAFTKAVDFNASAFTGKLTIDGSASADVITGGTNNDVITAAGGDDVIKLASGGVDKVVFGTHAANGKDTITGFTGGSGAAADTLNIAALGDGSTPATNTAVISTAAAQQAFVDDTYYIINTTGAAGNLTTSGTAAITDFTNLTQVAAYLNERFTAAATTDEGVFVVNQTGTSNAYVYSFDNDATAAIAAADLVLVGVITTDGNALTIANIVAA